MKLNTSCFLNWYCGNLKMNATCFLNWYCLRLRSTAFFLDW